MTEIEERIAKLERRNRWLARFLAAVCSLVCWFAFIAAKPTSTREVEIHSLKLQQLTLVDSNGAVRAWLGTDDRGADIATVFSICDGKVTRIKMTAADSESDIAMLPGEESRVADGTTRPVAMLFDDKGTGKLGLSGPGGRKAVVSQQIEELKEKRLDTLSKLLAK